MENHDQHLTDSERESYEKVIGRLQQARSVERFLLFAILIVVAIGSFLVYNNNRNSQRQQAAVIDAIQTETNKVNRHLDCVVAFFTRPNRADLSIKDIDNCTVTSDKAPNETFPLQIRPTPDQPQEPPTAAQPINPQAQGLEPMPSKPEQPNKPEEPEKPVERQAREILGIPVCIPFTNACVRR